MKLSQLLEVIEKMRIKGETQLPADPEIIMSMGDLQRGLFLEVDACGGATTRNKETGEESGEPFIFLELQPNPSGIESAMRRMKAFVEAQEG